MVAQPLVKFVFLKAELAPRKKGAPKKRSPIKILAGENPGRERSVAARRDPRSFRGLDLQTGEMVCMKIIKNDKEPARWGNTYFKRIM